MLRLTFTLVVALYAGFSIWGDPGEPVTREVAETVQPETRAPALLDTNASSRAEVTRTETKVDILVPDAATIAASTPEPAAFDTRTTPLGEPRRISLVQPAVVSAPGAPAQPEPATQARFLEVTGTRVNLRSGPSTDNRVVDSLVRGTLVEPLGDPVDGWIQLRAVDTGVTGYMAERFVAPAG